MAELRKCPFCQKQAVFIGVHDDEGNYKGMSVVIMKTMRGVVYATACITKDGASVFFAPMEKHKQWAVFYLTP